MARRKTRKQPSTQIAPLGKNANQETTDRSAERRVVARQAFSGPIPHPDIFRQYGEIIPNAPERILKVFEDDSSHVRDIQFAALRAECQDNKRAHWMAWSLNFYWFFASCVFSLVRQRHACGNRSRYNFDRDNCWFFTKQAEFSKATIRIGPRSAMVNPTNCAG